MGWIILVVVVLLVVVVVSGYNSLVSLRNKVKDQWSQIDVQLKKRADLIPNIVETVKGYAKHEKGTLEEVIKLRGGVSYDSMSNDEKIKTNTVLSRGISKIIALSEAYPELKANENFKDLSNQLTKLEEDIANARKYYNGSVRIFNDKVQIFPNSLFAGMLGYKPKDMFNIDESERNNVKIQF